MQLIAPREETAGRIVHPEYVNGRLTWHAGMNLHDLANRIQNGDPVQGWEGDPRLTLAKWRVPETGEERWELWRLDVDGEYHLVAKLPGHLDPSSIIQELIAVDARRGYDLKESIDRHNAKIDADRQEKQDDRMGAAADHLVWGLKRDGAAD